LLTGAAAVRVGVLVCLEAPPRPPSSEWEGPFRRGLSGGIEVEAPLSIPLESDTTGLDGSVSTDGNSDTVVGACGQEQTGVG